MEFNNYTEEEIEKILESNLEKKAYKKEDKAPKKLNVDDDEWLIEDGVVRRYRGHKKNLFVPEGVIRLAPSSLRYKELETIYLPNTLKTMLDFCLADNNLEEIDLPLNLKYIYPGILYGNKIPG